MSEQNLYPVFELTEPEEPLEAEEQRYRPSVLFDFEKGDFVRDATGNLVATDGLTAYKQWCTKISLTEQGSCLAYDPEDGVDMEGVRQQDNRQAAEAELERTITEALTADPRTDFVGAFRFTWDADGVRVSSEVQGNNWEVQDSGQIGPLAYSLDM